MSDRNRSERPDLDEAARQRASGAPESTDEDSPTLDSTLASLRQRILRLTCAIIARDDLAAEDAKQEVVTAIERIQGRVAGIPEGPARDDAQRRLSGVLAIADQMIAWSPSPSPAATRRARSPDRTTAAARDAPGSATAAPGAAGASDEVRDVAPRTFDPVEALQDLHGQVVQLEAMTHAASEAVTQLPFPGDREDRRVFDRVYALVTKVAEETDAIVRYGDELIAALAVYLKRRRAEAEAAPAKHS